MAVYFTAALKAFLRPKIVPTAGRKVNPTGGRSFFRDWRHQHILSPQILIAARDCLRITRIVQPESTHDRHAGRRALMYGTVKIGKHSVAQLEILAADGFDLLVVQLAGIRNCGAVVIIDFDGAGGAGVPPPGQAELPGTAVRAEQRTKSAELQTAQVKFGGEFPSRG